MKPTEMRIAAAETANLVPEIQQIEPTAGTFTEQESLQEPAQATPQLSEEFQPRAAALDLAAVEQLVRESVEEMMPQIVNRIARTLGINLEREEK